MTTGYENQDNLLRQRFADQWGTTTPIAWPNVDFTPTPGQSFVRFWVTDAGASQVSMGDPGNNIYRHSGTLYIMIFTPAGQGDEEALKLADQAAAIFRGWQPQGTGLRFLHAPYVRRAGLEQTWYHLNVLVPFQRDEHF